MHAQGVTPAFLVNANYIIDPADTVAFKAVVSRMAEDAGKRKGCSFLNVAQDVLDQNKFYLIEGWQSQEAFEELGRSAGFQQQLKEALALRIVDRSGTIFYVSGMQTLLMPT